MTNKKKRFLTPIPGSHGVPLRPMGRTKPKPKRKSPVRHTVHSHKRKGKVVNSYVRGNGPPTTRVRKHRKLLQYNSSIDITRNHVRIRLHDPEKYSKIRTHDVGRPGHTMRVSGYNPTTKEWETQAWMFKNSDLKKNDPKATALFRELTNPTVLSKVQTYLKAHNPHDLKESKYVRFGRFKVKKVGENHYPVSPYQHLDVTAWD